jgi:hypothetical protein
VTLGLLAFTGLMYAVFVVVREREAIRHAEELKAERTEISLLHVAHREQLDRLLSAHREDVQALCQRIQAPEIAVLEHQQANATEPDSMPLTDEQLAAQQEQAAFIQRLEQFENENAGILP